MNKDLLIKFRAYRSSKDAPRPYVYDIADGAQRLYYFGSSHTYDAADPQFEILKKYFSDFSEKTKEKNTIVLVEGGNWPIGQNEQEAIDFYGEMGYAVYLAVQKNIEWASPEPSKEYLYGQFKKYFNQEEIIYFYFASILVQYMRTSKKLELNNHLQQKNPRYREVTGILDLDFSLDNMEKIHKNMFDTQFDITNEQFFKDAVNPIKEGNIINKIVRFESEIRDIYILGEIEKYWEEEKSIFVVFGATHAEQQEPAIRSLSKT